MVEISSEDVVRRSATPDGCCLRRRVVKTMNSEVYGWGRLFDRVAELA